MNNVILYEEYRLIERSEAYVNRAWKGAHLLLFFLAFVFGSFCTFCFHMLMYLFDEKCVLFPKLLSLTSMRHNVIYEFMPSNKDLTDLPVDFVSAQWVEKSTCALPTYVPLVSGIFGLVWTTMFLMFSTGTRTLTGLQRPWRVLTPVFVFSLAMSILCIYSSVTTHSGLQELCVKLGEITGTSTCTYAVNVVTLVYERRIRGVYQATRLTIVSAWLHTACWICSTLLTLFRVVLAVDFQLVRVKVSLRADIDRLMERNETHLRTVSPDDLRMKDDQATTVECFDKLGDDITVVLKRHSDSTTSKEPLISEPSLVPAEQNKLDRIRAFEKVRRDQRFIPQLVYDILDKICPLSVPTPSLYSIHWDDGSESAENLNIPKKSALKGHERYQIQNTIEESEVIAKQLVNDLLKKLEDQLLELKLPTAGVYVFKSEESFMTAPDWINPDLTKEEIDRFDEEKKKKSNLKNASSQTQDEKKKSIPKRVLISDRVDDEMIADNMREPTNQQGIRNLPVLSKQESPFNKAGPSNIQESTNELGPSNQQDSPSDSGPLNRPEASNELGTLNVPGPANEPEPLNVLGPANEPEPLSQPDPSKPPEFFIFKWPRLLNVSGSSNEPESLNQPEPSNEPGPLNVAGLANEPGPLNQPEPSNEPGPSDESGPLNMIEPANEPGLSNQKGSSNQSDTSTELRSQSSQTEEEKEKKIRKKEKLD